MRPKDVNGHHGKEGFYEPLHKAKSSGATEARFEENTIFLFPPSFAFFLVANPGKNWHTQFILLKPRVWLQALHSVTQRDYNST